MELNSFIKTFDKRGKEGPIRCIFFCEFHPTAGPIISCQVCDLIVYKSSNKLHFLGSRKLYFERVI